MIRDILTRDALNITIGSSGTNKTIWELQSLEAAALGKPAFGLFETIALEPTWYVCFDRTERELKDKFANIKIPEALFRYRGYQSELHKGPPKLLIERVFNERPPDTKLIVIDGIGLVADNPISQHHTGRLISKLQDLRQQAKVTLKVIHHTPKVKGSDRYDDPREKGMGSAVWCQMSNTAVVIEKVDAGDISNNYRRVWVLHTDYRGDVAYAFQHQNGRLIHLPEGLPQHEQQKTQTIAQLAAERGISEWQARKLKAELLKNSD